jgi:glycosyltransferase involved in cell wall biosynthesis
MAGLGEAAGEHVRVADGAEQWRRELLGLLADEALRARLGAAGREVVCRQYTWAAHMGRLVAACERLVAGGPDGGRA